ncbi:hypothetical protein M427DRAFT_273739 [Gonapodya prolifera JEL478]|uniref:Fatty acid desaturase domain-containing protein n=1 Tax=Gonapodya prolifera (strain JEL478) TaxID=1344416 RepID=A0A139AXX7_GONPJ|nr:hypothetical protein M427DRAFT_273739 [Gonapodya prolifera JEL478]|eukprot:KXS21570.1 hypothetical protein M427DRAFT_273739 [Gonapodya prolifera JEL478]
MPATRSATNRTAESKKTTVDTKPHKVTYSGHVPRNFSLPETHGISLKVLRDAIPEHCFKRSVITSFSYVVQDLAIASALWYFAYSVLDGGSVAGTDSWMVANGVPAPARWAVWAAWQFVLGCVLTGVWVIAHECGHHAFSDYALLDNIVGWVLHSALLVPYFSWQISHGRHHHHTNHMTKDQVFVPHTRSETGLPPAKDQPVATEEPQYFNNDKEFMAYPAEDDTLLGGSPLGRLLGVLLMWILGWPAYIIYNAAGQDYGRWTSHFHPSSAIFEPKQWLKVILSDIGVFITIGALAFWCANQGFDVVFRYYFVPYLWVNFWLVTITYLQHSDSRIPHYREGEWNFLRGALCTVDRDFGLLNHVFHRITDTHVAHHCFSTMPHYNAGEATEHLKKILEPAGQYYYDNTPVVTSVWRIFQRCRFVEDEGDILFWKR